MERTKMLAAGAACLITAGVAYLVYNKFGSKGGTPAEEEKKEEEVVVVEEFKEEEIDPNWQGFQDPDYDTNHYLTKIEA